MNKDIKKVVLAYSGGLDTSVILKWLIETYKCEVITVTADLGQPEDLSGVEAKAYKTGASKAYVVDLREEMARDFVFPMMRGAARYENRYMLGTSIARPIITKALVDIARKEGADAIAHGATGKGNDQVRFEFAAKALAPDLKVIAPWREWDLMSRTALNAFAEKHGIPISKEAKRYSMDANMMHTSFEGSELEDPGNAPHESCHERCVPVEQAPNEPEIIEVSFEHGNPVAVNGEKMSPYTIIKTLAELAGKHGIGRDDMVENRYVGMKCRGVYENPAGTLLYALHRDLEGLCMDRELLQLRDIWPCPTPTPCTTATGSRPNAKPCRPSWTSPRRPSPVPCAPSCTRAACGPWPVPLPSPCSPKTWPPSKAATTTTRTLPASSASTACASACTPRSRTSWASKSSSRRTGRPARPVLSIRKAAPSASRTGRRRFRPLVIARRSAYTGPSRGREIFP